LLVLGIWDFEGKELDLRFRIDIADV